MRFPRKYTRPALTRVTLKHRKAWESIYKEAWTLNPRLRSSGMSWRGYHSWNRSRRHISRPSSGGLEDN